MTLGVLTALRNSEPLRSLFGGGTPPPLTAEQLTHLFTVSFSPRGSSRRLEEERCIGHWRDWVIDIEGGDALLVLEEEPCTISLEDVLMFATGADKIPPLGFPVKPSLDFIYDKARKYPEANTCALILRLPIHQTYEEFSDHMISGIVQSPYFGQA